MSKYLSVIGDVHGCFNTFIELVKKLPAENNRIVIIGDSIDRGPRSYELYKYIWQNKLEMVLGNHEYMFLKRNKSIERQELWERNGGFSLLQSIKKSGTDLDTVLDEMHHFFDELPLFIEVETKGKKLLISHAGINENLYYKYKGNLQKCFEHPIESQQSCLWTREDLADIPKTIQIVGHTPLENGPHLLGRHYHIDTGCVYQEPGMGYLTALCFDLQKDENPQIFKQENVE